MAGRYIAVSLVLFFMVSCFLSLKSLSVCDKLFFSLSLSVHKILCGVVYQQITLFQ